MKFLGLMRNLILHFVILPVLFAPPFLCAEERVGLVPSTPEQIAALRTRQSFLVAECVDPLTGTVSLSMTDLVAKGAQEISLQRVLVPALLQPFLPSDNQSLRHHSQERAFYLDLHKAHRGWVFLPYLYLEYAHKKGIKCPDSNGIVYEFHDGKLASSVGVSNVIGDTPSGKYDPKVFGGSIQTPRVQSHYDSLGNEILQIDAEGSETRTTYNALAKPVRIAHPDGAVEENIYRLDGTLACHIDPLGVSTHSTYDALGHVIETRREDAVETFVYDGNFLIEKVNAEGIKTRFVYDGAGRKILEEVAGDSVSFAYDSLGRLASRTEENLIMALQYDLLDRPLEEKKTDLRGNLLQITRFEYDSAGNQSAVIRGLESKERFAYDSLNRLTRKTDALGAVEETVYSIFRNELNQNVLQKKTTDPLGLQTFETYDAQNRLVRLEKRKDKPLLVEESSYDLRGLKTAQEEQIFDPVRTLVNQWDYDGRGRVRALIEGNGMRKTRYEYNSRGDQTAVHKPSGITLWSEYNRLGHLTHLFSSDGSVDHRLVVDRLGRLIGFDGTTRRLDGHGRILEEKLSNGLSVQSRYDTRGRRVVFSIPDFGLEVHYQYGPLHLERVETPIGPHVYVKYDLMGNLLQETLLGGGQTLERTYDLSLRPLLIRSPFLNQSISSYDAVGNILRMEIDGIERVYSYDALYQLTSEKGPFTHHYQFDALYNRLSQDEEGYTYNDLNEETSRCLYDPDGNLLELDGMSFPYDALGRLIRLETSDAVHTYQYDFLNRCTLQTTAKGKPVQFLYDGLNEIGSFDEKLRDFRVLGRTQKAEIGAAVACFLEGVWFIPLHDLQGNVGTLVPLQGGSIARYSYSAFGEERLNGGGPTSPWRFSSKRTDTSTGLVNYGRRYYLPSLGRWLTPDPLGFTAGPNLYAFLQNDPLIHLDAYGLLPMPISYKPWLEIPESVKRFGIAATHEVGSQALGLGRFAASTPYLAERGLNFLTGREAYTFASWQERQTKFFHQAEEWMYRTLPTDRTHPTYLAYRQGMSWGIDLCSLAAGGYGLAKGSMKAFQWGANAWKVQRGTYVAAERLGRANGVAAFKLLEQGTAKSQHLRSNTKKIEEAARAIENFLGEKGRLIRNQAGDPVFLSQDGSKCVRFDFKSIKLHNNPHAHVEIKVEDKWIKSGPIYPVDVPHN